MQVILVLPRLTSGSPRVSSFHQEKETRINQEQRDEVETLCAMFAEDGSKNLGGQ